MIDPGKRQYLVMRTQNRMIRLRAADRFPCEEVYGGKGKFSALHSDL